ncbi:nitrate reductase [Halobacteriales archaeon QS_5_70_17]|nr:MAG: nitrate reductase [Halobacteriales archaeon QS_5_70_17]
MRCAVGCGHVQRGVDVGYGIDGVRGDSAHPVSRGLACSRGISESADPDGEWLTRPLVRRGDDLVPTTWDLALARVAEEFEAATASSPHGLAVLGSGQQTNEAAYALGKLARGGVGTRNYDANTTLCMASAVTAYYEAFGADAPPPTYDDVPEAERHVVWGANPAAAHPVLFRWIRESADDGGLIAVDPVRSATAGAADRHVAPDPGGDLALARAVLALIVARGDVDGAFVEGATENFRALRDSLPAPARAARAAGVDPADVRALADALDAPTLLYWGMGVNQSARGTDTCRALIDLCLATGNLGSGSGPFSLTGQANSMGARVCASKGTWPGHRTFGDPDERAVVADAWNVPAGRLPDDPGPGPVGIVEAVGDEVEAVWTVATNPVASLPDADRVEGRLEDAFLVVQDAFRSETAELADVVLPAATWGETSGTVMNMERTVSRVRPATGTPPGIRQDLEIVAAVARRIAPDALDPRPDPAALFDEFAALTAGTTADCSGIDYDRLDADRAVRWPAPAADAAGGYRYRVDGGWAFPTASGRARFSTAAGAAGDRALPDPADDAYPLTLTTARVAADYNTGVRGRSEETAANDADGRSVARARVHPETLAEHLPPGAEPPAEPHFHSHLCVESRRGSVPVTADPDPGVPVGVVWLPIHHPMTNRLTVAATDPRSDEPNYKQCAVRLVAAPAAPEGDPTARGWKRRRR